MVGRPAHPVGGSGVLAGAALVLPAGHCVLAGFRGAVVLGAMGDDHHLARVHVPAVEEPLPGRVGHGHHDRGGRDDAGEHAPLVGRRGGEHRVQDGDHRDAHLSQDVEHIRAVAPAEDAVLVLDDRHVVLVQRVCRCPRARALADHQLMDDPRLGRLGAVDDPHDADVGPGADEVGGQRLGERGQAALGRGIGAEHAEADGHRRAFRGDGTSQHRRCRSEGGASGHPRGQRPWAVPRTVPSEQDRQVHGTTGAPAPRPDRPRRSTEMPCPGSRTRTLGALCPRPPS